MADPEPTGLDGQSDLIDGALEMARELRRKAGRVRRGK